MHRTKLLSSDPKRTDHLFGVENFPEVMSPLVEPDTATDQSAIDELLGGLGCLSNRASSNEKMRVLLSSFLMQAQRLEARVERRGGEMVIGWPHDESYWRNRSRVGYKIARQFREQLVKNGWLSHKVEAAINLYDGSGSCNGYLIADFVPRQARGIGFKSTEMVYLTRVSSIKSKIEDAEMDERTKALWELWKQEPLTHGSNRMWTASRVFGNDEYTLGGRFYGGWTNLNKERDRLKCTIGGKPVAEVDVSGMYLTLLFAITGKVPFQGVFDDPYSVNGVGRTQVKAVINSAIGGGTHLQRQPTKMMKDEGIGQSRLSEIRRVIIPRFECLKALSKNEMYSQVLEVHETEIMMRTVERLQRPIYILHDCLICKEEEALTVGKAMQEEFVNYCLEQGWMPFSPAYSIERDGEDKVVMSGTTNLKM